ncbi:MAG: hypothetical protein AAF125_11535, partial [Chloroflexota bacterium]
VPRLYLETIVFSYASHIFADMLTVAGVYFVHPIPKKFYLSPRGLRPRTGGIVDNMLGSAAALLVVVLLWGFVPETWLTTVDQIQGAVKQW